MRTTTCLVVFVLAIALSLVSCQSERPADILIENGFVWTGSERDPAADVVAVRDGQIIFVGELRDAERLRGSETRLFDASGGMVVPGFIDSHVHFLTGGFRLSSVELRDASTPEEFSRRIADYAITVEPGTWILGGDWDHSLWGGELPDRAWIDELTPDHPVWVNRLDGHMALANTAALRQAGIDATVADVDGGTIVRDGNGQLTGVFKDNAMGLVGQAVPDPTDQQNDRALASAMRYVAEQGVTSVHDMSGVVASYDVMKRAHENDSLLTRIYLAHPIWKWREVQDLIDADGRGDQWFRIGSLKGFVDGSLGSHTAAFFEPYTDAPNDSGFFVVEMAEMYRNLSAADSAGLHPVIHAIGDRAISSLLDVFDRVITENGPRDRRFRVEHAQHIAPADIGRFAGLGVIASMQPYHAIDDGRWAEEYIGSDRIGTTYAFKSLLESGARLAFGSDWFVAPPTPLEGIYAAVTRRTLDGENPEGWVPEQKISVEQALRAYTVDAAFAGFQDTFAGSLEPGKRADIVILDANLFEIAPENIQDVSVLTTIVDGRIIYQDAQIAHAERR